MTMRDINRYLAELLRARPLVVDTRGGFANDWIQSFADVGLVPVMLAMKVADPNAYKAVVQDYRVELLYQAFEKSDEAMDFMDGTWGSYMRFEEGTSPSEEDKKAARTELLEALIYGIWCNDANNPKRQHSYQVIGSSWGFDSLPRLAKII